jgi:hypothetical protein
MRAETAQAQASGIAGVSVDVTNHVWGEHATEFLATGTAVSPPSTGCRRPRPSPPSPSAWTSSRGGRQWAEGGGPEKCYVLGAI